MRTQAFVRLIGCVLACTIVAMPAYAQGNGREDAVAAKTRPVEITPFVSMGSSFSSRIGAAIAFAWTSKLRVEAEIGLQRDSGALNSSVNLLYDLPQWGRINPYLAAGVGLEEFQAAVQYRDSDVIVTRQMALAVNAGGGIKVPVDDKWAYRTDMRWSAPIGQRAPESWRIYSGVTLGTGKR